MHSGGLCKSALDGSLHKKQSVQHSRVGVGVGQGCLGLRAGCQLGWGLCGETLYACMSGLVRTGLTAHL